MSCKRSLIIGIILVVLAVALIVCAMRARGETLTPSACAPEDQMLESFYEHNEKTAVQGTTATKTFRILTNREHTVWQALLTDSYSGRTCVVLVGVEFEVKKP